MDCTSNEENVMVQDGLDIEVSFRCPYCDKAMTVTSRVQGKYSNDTWYTQKVQHCTNEVCCKLFAIKFRIRVVTEELKIEKIDEPR